MRLLIKGEGSNLALILTRNKLMGMGRVESKRLGLKCSRTALRCSYHIYQCHKLAEWLAPLLIHW